MWNQGIAVCTHMRDILFRQASVQPTPYPINKVNPFALAFHIPVNIRLLQRCGHSYPNIYTKASSGGVLLVIKKSHKVNVDNIILQIITKYITLNFLE